MARLRYIFEGDQLPVAPTPLGIEEEGDSWWSGVNLNSVAIPVASTIAAIALSASLAFAYQQQTEDIVPQPPAAEIYEEEFWQVWVPEQEPVRFLYLPDPEEIPAGSLYGVPEEELWQVYVPAYSTPSILQQWVDEEIVPQPLPGEIAEEELWQVYTPPYPPLRFVYLPDPEEIPAGSLVAEPTPEGTYIPIYRPRRRP